MKSRKPCIAFSREDSNGSEINILNTTVTLTNTALGSTIGLLPSNSYEPGKVNIEGSTISAFATEGAGIGGGYGNYKAVEISIINCNEIFAESLSYGAGIGGGYECATVFLQFSANSISAISKNYGAGIGGGYNTRLTFQGIIAKTINAISSGSYGAGIGGGCNNSFTTIIEIFSQTIIATSESYGAGIGGGGAGGTAIIYRISSETITATVGSSAGAGIGGGYLESIGIVNIFSASSINAVAGRMGGAGIGGGYTRSSGEVTITSVSSLSTVGGDNGGASIGGGCNNSTGTAIISSVSSLSAVGGYYGGAGIGGGYNESQGTVRIIFAKSILITGGGASHVGGGAGIGGGAENSEGIININQCSCITVTAKYYGAGIGGGITCSNAIISLISISSISAIGGLYNGAGIGGGYSTSSGIVSVSSVLYIACSGQWKGAGIGGGYDSKGTVSIVSISSINSSGGNTDDGCCSGIGGGYNNAEGNITIKNAVSIVATGGVNGGAGIGGGSSYSLGTITLTTISSISSIAGTDGAGIGGGSYESIGIINIISISIINSIAGKNGAGIGGGSSNSDANVFINKITTINAIGGNSSNSINRGAGIGGGGPYSNAMITISSVSVISAVGSNGGSSGIGGGNSHSIGKLVIISVSSISVESINRGAGIGGGFADSLGIVSISAVSTINAKGGARGPGIGGGGHNSSGFINITSVSSIRANGGKNGGAGIGSCNDSIIVDGFNNNIAITSNNKIPSSFTPNDTDLNIGIYGNVDITAIGGEGSAGIGGSADEENAGKINIEIGDGFDKPKVISLNKAMATDPADGRINNVAAIGNGITSSISSKSSVDLKINSGEIHAVDLASTADYSTTHSICIGGPNNPTTPSNLEINGGDIYMYGNATFYQNSYSVAGYSNGIILSSGASLNIGGTPPAVTDFSGDAITYPSDFKTTIRNFKDYGLKVSMGAEVIVDSPNTDIFLDWEYDGNVVPPTPANFTGNAIHTDLNARGIGEKFNVPFTYDSKINTAFASYGKVTLEKYILNYIATISPKHPVDYGITKTNDVNTVNKWITPPSTGNANVILNNLKEKTTCYIFIRLHTNKYFTGGAINNYNITILEITTTDRKTFTVRLIPNGGKGAVKTLKVLEDDKLTLPKNTFTRTGHTFKSWNTEKNGLGGSYKDSYVFTKYNLGKNLELYAIWNKNSSGGSSINGSSGGNGSGNDLLTLKGGDNNDYATAVVSNDFVKKNIFVGMILISMFSLLLFVVLVKIVNSKKLLRFNYKNN